MAELLVYEGLCQAPKQEQLYNVGLKDCSTSNELGQLLRHQLAMRSFLPCAGFVKACNQSPPGSLLFFFYADRIFFPTTLNPKRENKLGKNWERTLHKQLGYFDDITFAHLTMMHEKTRPIKSWNMQKAQPLVSLVEQDA